MLIVLTTLLGTLSSMFRSAVLELENLALRHDRRRILHCNVTAHPTAEWTGQKLLEAFPFERLPRYLTPC